MADVALVERSGRTHPVDAHRWRGDDGAPLSVSALPGIGREEVRPEVASQWRYAAALPVELEPVTLGEGWTPLLDRELDGLPVLMKAEWMNPTGSFKDRGVSVMVSHLRGQGATVILEDSSGNGGASVAAYAAAAGIGAQILAPATTSPAKLLQARAHGADVDLYPGTRQEVADEAVRRAERVTYASHSWHPFFVEGVKLLAYELWEQCGWRAPDVVVVPAGGGSLVLGCALGFAELLRSGHIDALPRIVGVQPQRCAPLAAAFDSGADRAVAGEWGSTIAEGARIEHPVRDAEVLAAVRGCGGAILAVSEEEIADATLRLAGIGCYVEPTSAVVAAALPRLRDQGVVTERTRTVAVLSGSGLKAAGTVEEILRSHASEIPDVE